MNETSLEPEESQGNNEAAAREEKSRLKFAELRDGLRQLLQKRGLPLDAGVSSAGLVAILSQEIGLASAPKYVDRLDTDWHEEYQRLVQQIGVLTGSEEDAEPKEIIDSVERHMASAA